MGAHAGGGPPEGSWNVLVGLGREQRPATSPTASDAVVLSSGPPKPAPRTMIRDRCIGHLYPPAETPMCGR